MGPYVTIVVPNRDSRLAGIFASTILRCRVSSRHEGRSGNVEFGVRV